VECEGNCGTLTGWPRIYERFRDLPGWENAAGAAVGWNDLDTLDIGDGTLDGLSNDEKQSAVTLWAMANAPMYLGGDLQVWVSNLGNGDYYVALFNMNATVINVRVPWSIAGFGSALEVRDLWTHRELGAYPSGFSTVLKGHAVQLLKVTAFGHAVSSPSTSYEAETAILGGSAVVANCPACSGGEKVGGLGLGANNNVTFNNGSVPRAGVYLMQINSMTQGCARIFTA
jgi:alpha-galactosidase